MDVKFSDQDLERIRQAVTQAERGTRGEIVPMIVPASARYREARYRMGLACAFLLLTGLLTVESEFLHWGWHAANAGWLLISVLAAYAAGYWLGTLKPVIRWGVSDQRMAQKVMIRAQQAFIEHGLNRTELRTGVLILLSLLEHRVQVLADKAINDLVTSGTWEGIVKTIVDGIHAGRPTDAFCDAIAQCGTILKQVYPTPEGQNPNELANRLIQEP